MRKSILIGLVCVAPLYAAAQGGYTINGQIGKLNKPAMAFLLIDNQGKQQLDSNFVINGKFQFKGTVPSPMSANLRIRHDGSPDDPIKRKSWDLLPLFVGNEHISITAKDSIRHALISGSPLNDESNRVNAALKPLYDKYELLNKEFLAQPESKRQDMEYTADLERRAKLIGEEIFTAKLKYIQGNPDKHMALMALNSLMGPKFDAIALQKTYDGLSDELKTSYLGKQVQQRISKEKKTQEGVVATDFSQPTADGKMIKLSDYRGKYVLLDFWASWCAPCRRENPNLIKTYDAFRSKGFEILGVSLDKPSDKAKWLKAIADDKLSWMQVSDLKGWENEAARLYEVTAIPMNFLIDPSGKIIAKDLRGEILDQKLHEILDKK